ncbi:MAG: UDP-N-acetylmuramoyl-L-alanyl-D-glutamate--2,6-diaminopimelate ligase [Polyangiaceae bacterium]|nr:UDP-N-acetylmuramoyl-L-alanyl-D-glutamate--2,6-diaminopimelate ligase [Polyangiaceae bacterium]
MTQHEVTSHADRELTAEGGRAFVRLEDLVREIPGAVLVSGDGKAAITGVRHDSRRVEPGDLFVARAGARASGESFVSEALGRGARAVLVAKGSSVGTGGAARIEADDVPKALAFAAEAVHGHPTRALDVVGITGTNGKTTTSYLAQACINAGGGRCGVVGTLGYRFEDLDLEASHTSPEADELARVAAAMRARGATHLVMEVSSIAVAAARVEAVRFRVSAFTNLTQDHLDYHATMEAYAAAKERLFTGLLTEKAALNVDDAFGQTLAGKLVSSMPAGRIARFSARAGAAARGEAEVAPVSVSHSPAGISMIARTPAGEVPIRCDEPAIDDVVVLVDYAHTPDALERVLESVRALGSGRIVCVFGCGGDRDPKKRPLMGEAVGRGADVAIVTNDNPRSEDPEAIARAILPGLEGGRARVSVELDRAKAIERAVLEAQPGDLVLIAGKGHEPYQIVGRETFPFDDREQARRALGIRRASLGSADRRSSNHRREA